MIVKKNFLKIKIKKKKKKKKNSDILFFLIK